MGMPIKTEMNMKIVEYEHHGRIVKVRKDLKGLHRENCLCFSCDKLKINCLDNCEIAQATYENCAKFGIVTPMWEFPKFVEKK